MLEKTQPITKIIYAGCFAILALDIVGSLASLALGFHYLSLADFLIYAAVGFIGTRKVNIKMGILAAVFVGLVDLTIGWTISWIIGPGRLTEIPFGVGIFVTNVIRVTVAAAIVGLVGGVTSLLFGDFVLALISRIPARIRSTWVALPLVTVVSILVVL